MSESLASPVRDADLLAQLASTEGQLAAEVKRCHTLNRVAAAVGANLSLDAVVQAVVDGGVELSGAAFGAFFYNVIDAAGGSYTLYVLSGAPREAFAGFPMPRNTAVFAPTFEGAGIVRSDDICKDPRYGRNAPFNGMPDGHLPVRSYLAAPVVSRAGEVLGGLFFGHPEPGVFKTRDEDVIGGLAAQAAVTIDNVRMHERARQEIEERGLAQQRQRLLLNELNHRVKNTLATVQSIAGQTLRTCESPLAFQMAFESRLAALSETHNLLTAESWEGASLTQLLRAEFRPYDPALTRLSLDHDGDVRLNPNAAVAFGMAVHELTANAVRHGSLSHDEGRVSVRWRHRDGADRRLEFDWTESGGPQVARPQRSGFGSRLLERGLAHQLAGTVRLEYDPKGLHCHMNLALGALEHAR